MQPNTPPETGKPQDARSFTRGILFAILTIVVMLGVYGSWRSLFAFDLVMCVIYTFAAFVGAAGAWALHRDQQLLCAKARQPQAKA